MKPKFPGFTKCMGMMHSLDPQIQEDGFYWLLAHALEYVGERINAFQLETDMGLRCWLLELIDEAIPSDDGAEAPRHEAGSDLAVGSSLLGTGIIGSDRTIPKRT